MTPLSHPHAVPTERPAVGADADARPEWRHWPIHWRDLGSWLVAYVVLVLVMTGIGYLIVHVWETSWLAHVDHHVAVWFADQRTPERNDLGQIGAALADAYTLTPAILLTCVAFVFMFRRWNETLLLLAAILLEKSVFVTTTFIVGRDRPPVGQLDGAPPTSSYPSGHVAAAAVFYVVVALIVTRHVRSKLVRALAWTVAVLAPIAVASSRMLLGMHYLTDVTVGAVLGLTAVVIGTVLSRRAVARIDARERDRLGTLGHLDRGAEAQQTTTERDGTQREPSRSEAQTGDGVAQPVHAEQHP